jgi:5'-deoxynucleotidase YfbR-like HD superfamily hydrolase
MIDVKATIAQLDAYRKNPPLANYWSQTYSGEAFYYDADKIASNVYKLEDIAHHLASVNRYGGAAIYPYSVAQHSVALAIGIWDATQDPFLCLDALFHDAGEAYVGDMRKPLKDRCPDFVAMEKPIDAAIRQAMQRRGIAVPSEESDIVRVYDRRVVANERQFVMQPSKQHWNEMDGHEPIPGLPPHLFEEKDWHEAKLTWLRMVEAYALMASMFNEREKYLVR